MATLDLDLSDILIFSESLPSDDIYGSVYDANIYFANRLRSDVWWNASDKEKYQALVEATEHLENLKYSGTKTSDTQPLSFPRNDETTIPTNVIKAAYEEAITILVGETNQDALEAQKLKRVKFGQHEREYWNMGVSGYVLAGILSLRAYRLIKPYLEDNREINLYRV